MAGAPERAKEERNRPQKAGPIYRPAPYYYVKNIYRGRRPLIRRVLPLIAIVIFGLLLVADALYVVSEMRTHLTAAYASLTDGMEALENGNFRYAERAFTDGRVSARRAGSAATHPTLLVATFIPGLRNDALVARDLPRVTELTAQAGLNGIEGARRLGASGGDVASALYKDGRVQIDALRRGVPYVRAADANLTEALEILNDNPEPSLGRLREGVDEARDRLVSAADVAGQGVLLMESVPRLLGADKPHEYLLAFQAPSQARGTGGLIGLYGVLVADDGVVNLTHIGEFTELTSNINLKNPPPSITSVEEFTSRYLDALKESGEINFSADFPAVAKGLLGIYRRATGEKLDGVLTTDPPALQKLLAATGPIDAGPLGQLTADSATASLLQEAYLKFEDDPQAQNATLIATIKNFYRALGSGKVEGPVLLRAFADAMAGQHIKIYSSNPIEEAALAELGATGTFAEYAPGVQHIFHNNLAFNRVDFFLHRSIDTTIAFNESGHATVTTEISLKNDAPSEPSILTRSYNDTVGPGINYMQLNAVLPLEAQSIKWTIKGDRRRAGKGLEAGLPLQWVDLKIPQGTELKVILTYEIPGAVDVLTGKTFDLALFPQPMINTDTYSLTVQPPAGYVANPGIPARYLKSGDARVEGRLDRPQEFQISVTPLQ